MTIDPLFFYIMTRLPIIAFVCEYVDSSIGMGYGTILAPLLLLLGFQPLDIIPAILISELATGLYAGSSHHSEGNATFYKKGTPLTNDLKITLILGLCSLFGTSASVFTALSIPRYYLQLYLGIIVLSMGIIVLLFINKTFKFSFIKIIGLGILASFNKGISGGGYGPLVTSGQILSGVNTKNAVSITSLSEFITCLIGIIGYLIFSPTPINYPLALAITLGAVLAVPLATKRVKKMNTRTLKIIIGIVTILLGSLTIYNTIK